MKIPVWVEFSKEVEVSVSAEDVVGCFRADSESPYYIVQTLNNFAGFLNALTPSDIEGLNDAQRDTVAKYLRASAAKFERTEARPKVVCLCGSTRFFKTFMEANYRETMAGNIVLSVGFYSHASDEAHGEDVGITSEQKTALDELHKRKIDLADQVLILNVGGYIGESTKSELDYAIALGKQVRYLEPEKVPA